jgi:hypothetical protein
MNKPPTICHSTPAHRARALAANRRRRRNGGLCAQCGKFRRVRNSCYCRDCLRERGRKSYRDAQAVGYRPRGNTDDAYCYSRTLKGGTLVACPFCDEPVPIAQMWRHRRDRHGEIDTA